MSLFMTPSEIYKKFLNNGRTDKYAKTLAELNGCNIDVINNIIKNGDYFNGNLPENFDYVCKNVPIEELIKVNNSNNTDVKKMSVAISKDLSMETKESSFKVSTRSNSDSRVKYSMEEKDIMQECILKGMSANETLEKLGYSIDNSCAKSVFYALRRKLKEQGLDVPEGKRGRKSNLVRHNGIVLSSTIVSEDKIKETNHVKATASIKKDIRKFFQKSHTEIGSISEVTKENLQGVSKNVVSPSSSIEDFKKENEVSDSSKKEKKSWEEPTIEIKEPLLHDGALPCEEQLNEGNPSLSESKIIKKEWSQPILEEVDSVKEEPLLVDLYSNMVTKADLETALQSYNEMRELLFYQINMWKSSSNKENVKEYNIKYFNAKLARLECLGLLLKKLTGVVKDE